MTDDTKKRDPREIVRAIDRIAEDVLDPDYPDELVDEDLREMGLDPEAVGRRGADLAARLLAERREALRDEAIAAGAPLADRLAEAKEKPRRTREQMLERIARADADPRYAGQLGLAARGRRPEEPTDDELAALCEKLDALGIPEPDGTSAVPDPPEAGRTNETPPRRGQDQDDE
jgi:hypothetical protein